MERQSIYEHDSVVVKNLNDSGVDPPVFRLIVRKPDNLACWEAVVQFRCGHEEGLHSLTVYGADNVSALVNLDMVLRNHFGWRP